MIVEKSRVRNRGLAWACALIAGTTLLPVETSEAAPVQARKTDDFVDSIGICTKVGHFDDNGWNMVRTRLGELGVRFYREGLEHVDDAGRKARLQGLYDSYGMKMLALCGPHGNDNLQPQNGNLNHIPPKLAGIKPFLYAVEGPNEPDLFWHDPWNYGGHTNRVDQVVWYQNTLYDAIKNYSATSDVPVSTFALAFGENSSQYSGKTIKHDLVAWHHYNNPWKPNPWQLSHERTQYNSTKPGILTEHGYNVHNVSHKAQGKYNARSAAYFFDWNNNAKTFFYVLGPDGEDYGILNADWTPRPAFNALKNVISYVKEGSWSTSTKTWSKPNFTPGSLDFTLSGDTADVWWRLLQKSNGEFYLLLWHNADSYSSSSGDIDSSRNVTISFAATQKVMQYRGNDSGVYTETTLTNGATSVGVNVPDSLMILKISPGTAPPTGSNLISNPSFDAENFDTQTPSGWSEWGGPNGTDANAAFTEAYGGSRTGTRHLTHWRNTAYEVGTDQFKTGLTNGLYTLRAWVRGGDHTGGRAEMQAWGFGGTARVVNIPNTGTWTQLEIKDINVTNNACNITFYSKAQAGQWIYVDDVEFFKQTTSSGLVNGGIYELEPVCAPGMRLDVAGGSSTPGANVQIWNDNNLGPQRWKLELQSDGAYELIPQNATSCRLDVASGGTSNGSNVQIWTDNNLSPQRWKLEVQTDGAYELIPQNAPGLRLDVNAGSSSAGANVQIWTDNNAAAQRWRLLLQ